MHRGGLPDGSAECSQPTHGLAYQCVAYPRKDLADGETLDGVGGYAAYGLIEIAATTRPRPGLPICLRRTYCCAGASARMRKIFLADVEHQPG